MVGLEPTTSSFQARRTLQLFYTLMVLEERFELSFSFEKQILSLPRIPIPPFELVEDNRIELFSGVYKTHALTDKLILYKIILNKKIRKVNIFLDSFGDESR